MSSIYGSFLPARARPQGYSKLKPRSDQRKQVLRARLPIQSTFHVIAICGRRVTDAPRIREILKAVRCLFLTSWFFQNYSHDQNIMTISLETKTSNPVNISQVVECYLRVGDISHIAKIFKPVGCFFLTPGFSKSQPGSEHLKKKKKSWDQA